MNRRFIVALVALLVSPLLIGARGASPKVVSSSVEDGQDDVDPAVAAIRVEFDQPMDRESWSIVGGGPTYPQITAKPTWPDEKTVVIPVKLEADHEYWLSLNSDTFQGFRSAGGKPAAPQPLGFKTRAVGAGAAPEKALTPERNRAAIDALRKAIDNDYSYRDRLKLDWEKLFADHRAAMESATTPNQFARAVARILRHAQDGHVYVRAGERVMTTHANAKSPNVDFEILRLVVPQWKQYDEDGAVASGRFASPDVGYLMIAGWNAQTGKLLEQAFDAVKDAPGLIVDVRMNGGGDELVARRFAGRFIDKPAVYSKNRIREGGQWNGPFDRVVQPRPVAERYDGRVAVLIGPKVGSSCESFVLMMKQSPRCKLIGDVTKGSSGRPQPHDLGNGVEAVLSSWEDQLPDGTVLEGVGVMPDIGVRFKPTGDKPRDAVLEAGLRHAKVATK